MTILRLLSESVNLEDNIDKFEEVTSFLFLAPVHGIHVSRNVTRITFEFSNPFFVSNPDIAVPHKAGFV